MRDALQGFAVFVRRESASNVGSKQVQGLEWIVRCSNAAAAAAATEHCYHRRREWYKSKMTAVR